MRFLPHLTSANGRKIWMSRFPEYATRAVFSCASILLGTVALVFGPAVRAAADIETGQILDRGRFPRTLVLTPVGGATDILAPIDTRGELRITGLEPGDYEIASLRLTAAAPVPNISRIRVGDDGRLAVVTCQTVRRRIAANAALGKCAGRKLAASQRPKVPDSWIEPIAFDDMKSDNAVIFEVDRGFRVMNPPPCDPLPGRPDTCNRSPQRNYIDINASSSIEMTKLARTNAAELIVAERTKNGAFNDLPDFIRRVCTRADIDFGDVAVSFGSTKLVTAINREPKQPSFRCSAGGSAIELLGQKFVLEPRQLQFGAKMYF